MIKNLIKNYQNTNIDLYEFFFNISVVKIHKIRFILNLKLKMLGPLWAPIQNYFIEISLAFFSSGIILSKSIAKSPFFNSASLTLMSSEIVNDLSNCLVEIPL